jgi:hypothetical protein
MMRENHASLNHRNYGIRSILITMLKSRTISISINRDPKTVYEFVSNLENLPRWANMAFRSIKQLNGEWIVETPQGPANVSLTERNRFGVLDHFVKTSAGIEVLVPMRVVQNDEGSEVIFTLFQTADMSDERFAEDIRMVYQDLNHLKNIIEEGKKVNSR